MHHSCDTLAPSKFGGGAPYDLLVRGLPTGPQVPTDRDTVHVRTGVDGSGSGSWAGGRIM